MSVVVLQGTLGAFKLPEILTFLHSTQKTGTLTLKNAGSEAYVFFDSGSLIYAGSNQEAFRLSAILTRKKKITKDEIKRIDELMRHEGGRFGELAVQQKLLSDAQLRDYLKIQVSEILYDCFVWTSGSFSFAESMQLPQHAVTISVDLGNLIMEGARRIDEWEQCLRLLPDKSAVFRVVANPKDDKITLTADEWKILFLINGTRSLAELCHDAEDDPFHVYKVVYGLLGNKLIELVTPETKADLDETGSMRAKSTSPATTVRQDLPQVSDDTMRQVPRGELLRESTTVRDGLSDDTNLLISEEAHLSYNDVVRTTVAQLTVQNGDSEGKLIPLVEKEYLVGRQRENDIQLIDLGVSGLHARIYRGPEGYVVEDLKSRNGTWLNGTRVFHAVMKHGDIIRLGATDIQYEVLYDGTRAEK